MASSPLHAAYTPSRLHPNQHDEDQHSPLLPASGTGSGSPRGSPSKQTRRLQLRNAGFRGATLPARKTTPNASLLPSTSTSTNWSSVNTTQQSSDAENVSPLSGKRASESLGFGSLREPSSGRILQDIGNANSTTLRQANSSKRVRPRVTSGRFWAAEGSSSLAEEPASSPFPPPQGPSARARSIRTTRAKMNRPRRSVSGETRKYVDHLETQLSEAQAQLSAMTSPTVTREQSSKMRHLNAETKQLQQDVTAWEERFEERVQQEMEKHFQLEASLRAQVRSLQEEAEETNFRIQTLETDLETTTQNMAAVEVANVNLEKRLEIMSDLLAASPTKIDLHAGSPGRPRQGRPKSTMPRFPTAGSLAASPERQRFTQPTSPSPSHHSQYSRFSLGDASSPRYHVFSPQVDSSDDEDGANSDASLGMQSVIVCPPTQKVKPARRMRRFGAGSIGPKPLILPSTSHCEQIPASAPPFDRDEQRSVFPFSPDLEPDTLDSSLRSTRRRASSDSSPIHALPRSPSPLMNFSRTTIDNHSLLGSAPDVGSPRSRTSPINNPRDFSSIGSAVGATLGRNLMDELTAVQTSDTTSSNEERIEAYVEDQAANALASSPFNSDTEDHLPSLPDIPGKADLATLHGPTSRFPSGSSTAVAPSTAFNTLRLAQPPRLPSQASSRSSLAQSKRSLSTLDSLRTAFSELFRSPVELAKHLIQTAQSRMRIPRPLLTVQWWLVGVLLGPMARRRMLGRTSPTIHSDGDQRSLLDEPIPEDPLAYGTAYQTPHSSPSSRALSLVAGKGKKRASSPSVASSSKSDAPCPHHPKRFKHSPLLWLKFSMTLAFAVGVAFKDGPSSLLKDAVCHCKKQRSLGERSNTGDELRSLLVTPGSREVRREVIL